MLVIETIVHYTVNPGEDPNIKAFGIPFDAASPMTWAIAAVLIVGGFVLARMTWTRVGARLGRRADRRPRQGTRRMSTAIELARRREELRHHQGDPQRQPRRSRRANATR